MAPVAEFSPADYAVFVSSLIASLAIGAYHWWKQRGGDTKEFLMGSGEMSPVPSAISMLAGTVSAISIIGNSAEMYYQGSQLWTSCIGVVLGGTFMGLIVVPVLYPLKLTSMYGYFELRWESAMLRKIISMIQLINTSIYSGICLYAPSLAISAVTPINHHLCIVILTCVCTATATLGGAKAVVYTDTFQAGAMFAGVIAVIIQGCLEVGGIQEVWKIDQDYGRINFSNFDPDPRVLYSFWSSVILGVYFTINAFGICQSQFQRWASVKTIKQSYFIIITNVVGLAILWSLIFLSGLVVFAVYSDCDPLTDGRIDKYDQIIVYFVVDKLGYIPGIPGLFVAGVFSGVLSTVSSQINAIATISWDDFLQNIQFFEKREKIAIRVICVLGGLFIGILGLMVGSLGSIIQIVFSISDALSGPINGLLIAAICCPWLKLKSGVIGMVFGLALNIWVAMGSLFNAPPPELLPLSTEGCLPQNITLIDYIGASNATASAVLDMDKDDVFDFYKISYCYFGILGALTTLIMANIVSCIIGFEEPADIPTDCVNSRSLNFYRWLCSEAKRFTRKKIPPNKGGIIDQEKY